MTTSVHLIFSQCTCSRCKTLYASVLRFRAFRTWAFLSEDMQLQLRHNLHTPEVNLCLGVTCRDRLFCLKQRSPWLVALPNGISLRSCVSQTGFSDHTASRAEWEMWINKKYEHYFVYHIIHHREKQASVHLCCKDKTDWKRLELAKAKTQYTHISHLLLAVILFHSFMCSST